MHLTTSVLCQIRSSRPVACPPLPPAILSTRFVLSVMGLSCVFVDKRIGRAEMEPKIVAVRKIYGHKLRTVKRETISPPSPGLLPSGSTRAIDLVGENSKSHRAHRTRQFCFFVLPSTRSAQITRNHSTHSCRPIQTEQVGGQVRACKLPSAPMQTRERSVRVLAPGAPGKRGLFHYWPPTWTLWSTCRRIRRTNSAPSLPMRPHVPTGGGACN